MLQKIHNKKRETKLFRSVFLGALFFVLLGLIPQTTYGATSTATSTGARPQIVLFTTKDIKESNEINSFELRWSTKNTESCEIKEISKTGVAGKTIGTNLKSIGSMEYDIGKGVKVARYILTCWKNVNGTKQSVSERVTAQTPERRFPKIKSFTIIPQGATTTSTFSKTYTITWSSNNSSYCTIHNRNGYSSSSDQRGASGSFSIETDGNKSPGSFNLVCTSPAGFVRNKSLSVSRGEEARWSGNILWQILQRIF